MKKLLSTMPTRSAQGDAASATSTSQLIDSRCQTKSLCNVTNARRRASKLRMINVHCHRCAKYHSIYTPLSWRLSHSGIRFSEKVHFHRENDHQMCQAKYLEKLAAASIGRDISYIYLDGEFCAAQNLVVDDYEKKLRSGSSSNTNSSSSNPPLENKFSSLCDSLPGDSQRKKGHIGGFHARLAAAAAATHRRAGHPWQRSRARSNITTAPTSTPTTIACALRFASADARESFLAAASQFQRLPISKILIYVYAYTHSKVEHEPSEPAERAASRGATRPLQEVNSASVCRGIYNVLLESLRQRQRKKAESSAVQCGVKKNGSRRRWFSRRVPPHAVVSPADEAAVQATGRVRLAEAGLSALLPAGAGPALSSPRVERPTAHVAQRRRQADHRFQAATHQGRGCDRARIPDHDRGNAHNLTDTKRRDAVVIFLLLVLLMVMDYVRSQIKSARKEQAIQAEIDELEERKASIMQKIEEQLAKQEELRAKLAALERERSFYQHIDERIEYAIADLDNQMSDGGGGGARLDSSDDSTRWPSGRREDERNL
ncbi:unnamed protein product [Trichogramma brassicae]|uniref:Uncharacterized protein n=1 Tax=Trichogramma brassicae TaxID=86971 RepID=A0A6H5J7G0_9HYME|nr:unnamed protein product [Trichogramma brassicae]